MKISNFSNFFCFWCISLTLIILFILEPNPAQANFFYVATNGNDSNTGSEASPFLSIKKGVASLSPGDTLYVKSGTYKEAILSWTTNVPHGISWDNAITVATYPGHTVTIQPPSGTAFFWLKGTNYHHLIIDGFIIDGQNLAWHGVKFMDGTHHIRVKNCEIKNTKYSGILVTLSKDSNNNPLPETINTYDEFINMNVHHNGTDFHDHGAYIETSYNLVQDSEFHKNTGYGIQIYHAYLTKVANYNVVNNTVVHDNSTSGSWSCGLILSSGEGNKAYNNVAYGNFAGFCAGWRVTNALFYNNISYGNDYYGMYVGQNATEKSTLYNNSIYKNGQYGIFVGDGSQDAVVRNNIAYNNTSGNIYLGKEIGTILSNNLTTDPKFMSPSTNDFHLMEGSSAIDRALAIDGITTDFDNQDRNQGTAPDIGALEFIQIKDTTAPLAPRNVSIN